MFKYYHDYNSILGKVNFNMPGPSVDLHMYVYVCVLVCFQLFFKVCVGVPRALILQDQEVTFYLGRKHVDIPGTSEVQKES